MTTEQLNQLYLVRQSCRSFSDRSVAKESVEKICALAGTAPSACNLQPWRVYAVTGEKLPVAKALLKARGKKEIDAYLAFGAPDGNFAGTDGIFPASLL